MQPRPPASSFRVGIDENGLGPRLGPLVVTGVLARTDEAGGRRAESRPRGKLAERLNDSKKLVAFGDSLLGEAWARAVAKRAGTSATSADELVHWLSIDTRDHLRAPCPADHAGQCWSAESERFGATDEMVTAAERDLAHLAKLGVDVQGARVAVVCTDRLNAAARRGLTRFHVDLHAMERLAIDARARAGEDVIVTCGKVGGFNSYASALGPLNGRLHVTMCEGRARSEYAFPGLGRIAFVRDADARHLLVCMASLIGKWVRDLLMARVVRYHREANPELPMASGYHDPVTTRFIAASALARKRRALPDTCFERNRASTEGDVESPG